MSSITVPAVTTNAVTTNKEVCMLLATLATSNPVVYVIVKLCVLALAVAGWWLLVSYPTHPVI